GGGAEASTALAGGRIERSDPLVSLGHQRAKVLGRNLLASLFTPRRSTQIYTHGLPKPGLGSRVPSTLDAQTGKRSVCPSKLLGHSEVSSVASAWGKPCCGDSDV